MLDVRIGIHTLTAGGMRGKIKQIAVVDGDYRTTIGILCIALCSQSVDIQLSGLPVSYTSRPVQVTAAVCSAVCMLNLQHSC